MVKTRLNDLEMHYEVLGAGRPIFLLHGLALDHSVWLEMADLYANQAQFILPDLRGHGLTPVGRADASLEQFAEDIFSLADHLGFWQFALAGHSMGGYIALAAAEAHPERLTGIALVTSHAREDSAEKRALRLDEARRALVEGTQSSINNLIQRMIPEGEHDLPDQHVYEVMRKTSASGFSNVQTAIAGRPNRLAVAQALRCPLLAIAGGKDQLVPVDIALEAAEAAPQGRKVCLPDVGHLPMIDVPYTLGALIVSL